MTNTKTFSVIYTYLTRLASLSGTNEKKNFIFSNNDCSLLEVYKWLFDNSRISGIAEKKWDKIKIDPMFDDMDDFTFNNNVSCIGDIFAYLDKHHTGSDNDVKWVKMATEVICYNDEEKEMVKKIVCKNLPLGVDVKTINKVYPNLISSFEVALCSKLSDYPNALDGNTEWEINCKIDGGRCVAIKEDGKTRLISRQGKVWEGLVEVEDAINNLSEDNIVLDGELTISDFMNYPSDEVYKSTMKIVSSKEEHKSGITLNAFDILTLNEWKNGCKTIQKDRRIHLDKLLSENKSKALYCVPAIYIGKDPNKVSELMKDVVEPNKWEGLVLKDTSKFYEHKRCKSWLKVKQMETYDLTIIDTFEGENSLVGKLGGFIAEVTLPDGKFVHTKIGSGFSLENREEFWSIRESLIGKNIEVQGFELTTNDKSKDYSIRFPVFKGFIEDGKELNGDYKN